LCGTESRRGWCRANYDQLFPAIVSGASPRIVKRVGARTPVETSLTLPSSNACFILPTAFGPHSTMDLIGAFYPMKLRIAASLLIAAAALPLYSADVIDRNKPERPKAGKPEIMPLSEVKPGMKGTAWTVLQGTEPEPVPIEILGRLKN